MQCEMKLKQPYYDLMKTKIKTYEIRLFDEKRQKLSVGDVIVFKNDSNLEESFQAVVVDLLKFPTFAIMLESLNFNQIGMSGKSKQEIENIYHEFYSKEEEQKYVVLAIKVKVI